MDGHVTISCSVSGVPPHANRLARGFGRQMTGTPMVIMWINQDGHITLSQRSASDYIMPTVDSNPPRVAQTSLPLSVVSARRTGLSLCSTKALIILDYFKRALLGIYHSCQSCRLFIYMRL